MTKQLTINHAPGTQLIYVTAEYKDGKHAAELANMVANTYLGQQQQRLNSPASQRANRYSEQLSELKNKVAEAQQAVTEFRQQTGLTDITANNSDIEGTLLTDLEQKYQASLTGLRAAEVKQAADQSVSTEAITSNLMQGLKNQLATKEAELAEKQTSLGSNHPKVIELQSQIDSTRKALTKEVGTFSSNVSSELTNARSLASKLRSAVEAQRAKVATVRKQQDEGAKLFLELESAQAVYKRALDGYDKVIAAAGGGYNNVSLLSSAEVPVKATKPNKIKLLLLGAIAGMFLGIAAPFTFELLIRRRVRCRDDLERDLTLPVLAEFDMFQLPSTEAAG